MANTATTKDFGFEPLAADDFGFEPEDNFGFQPEPLSLGQEIKQSFVIGGERLGSSLARGVKHGLMAAAKLAPGTRDPFAPGLSLPSLPPLTDKEIAAVFESSEPIPISGGKGTKAVFGALRMPDKIADALDYYAQVRSEKRPPVTFKDAPIARIIRPVVEGGVPSMVAALGTGVLLGPGAALGLLGLGAFGEGAAEQFEAGGSIAKSTGIGALYGAAEVGGEMLVLPRFIKGVKVGMPLRKAFTLFLENATQEGVTGFAQQFLDTFGKETTKGANLRTAVQRGWDAGLKAVPENAWVGGATALIPGGVGVGVQQMRGRKAPGAPATVQKPGEPALSPEEYESQRYNLLLERAGAGDRAAIDKLNEMQQGAALPTYENLLDRIAQGDLAAAAEIQEGRYFRGAKPKVGPTGQMFQQEGVPGADAARIQAGAAQKPPRGAKIVAPKPVGLQTTPTPTVTTRPTTGGQAPQGEIAAAPPAPAAEKQPNQMTLDELKQESASFDEKIRVEKERLDTIAPGRQIFGGVGIDNLSEPDVERMHAIEYELARRTGKTISQAEAKERVMTKRAARIAAAQPAPAAEKAGRFIVVEAGGDLKGKWIVQNTVQTTSKTFSTQDEANAYAEKWSKHYAELEAERERLNQLPPEVKKPRIRRKAINADVMPYYEPKQAPPGGVAPAPEGLEAQKQKLLPGIRKNVREHLLPTEMKTAEAKIKVGDIIGDGLITGKVTGEGSIKMGKQRLAGYKVVTLVGGREQGRAIAEFIPKQDAHLVMTEEQAAKVIKDKTHWGSGNKGVTQAEYGEIKKRQAEDKGKLKGGREAGGTILFNPQEWSDAVKIGMYHLEAGARAFNDWAAKMIGDYGERISPHLQNIWKEIQPTLQAVTGTKPQTVFDVAKEKVIADVESAKRVKAVKSEITAAYHKARAQRVAKYEGVLKQAGEDVPIAEAHRRAMASMGGPLIADRPMYTPPALSAEEWDSVGRRIDGMFAPGTETYKKIEGQEALRRYRNGIDLRDFEIKLLGKVFGPRWAKMAGRNLRRYNWIRTVEDILGLQKLGAGMDVQMRRQARSLRARYPWLYTKGIAWNLEGYFSAKQAARLEEETRASPNHIDSKDHKLRFLDDDENQPEQFWSRLSDKLPGWKQSKRGFVVGFNRLQQALWDYHIDQFSKNYDTTTDQMKEDLADYLNTFMGVSRPKTWLGQAANRILRPILWSPSFTWSRVRTPSLILTNPTMRGEVAKTLGSFVGSGLMFMAAAGFLGAWLWPKEKVVEWDPRSPDFGKTKLGNTRFDVFGDYGTYIRALCQAIAGSKKTASGKIIEQARYEPLLQLARNKRSPAVSLITALATGKTYYGGRAWEIPKWREIKAEGGLKGKLGEAGEALTKTKPGEVTYFIGREALSLLPFFLSGMTESAWNDGWATGLLAGGEEFFSGSTVSYKPTAWTRSDMTKDIAADGAYGLKWDDLTEGQQKTLRGKIPEIEIWEQKAAVERADRSEYETYKAGRRVTERLSPDIQTALAESNVILALSRKWGDWKANDERYEQYQDYATEEIARRIGERMREPSWSGLALDQKRRIIMARIEAAKEIARSKVRKNLTQGEKKAG
jgi:hypothetical protein